MTLRIDPDSDGLACLLAGREAVPLQLHWLGQAGFVIAWDDRRLMIDPYLSDALALKYAGTRFPHQRMMPPPVTAEQIDCLDLVLCTHAHSDHMDPGLLPGLLKRLFGGK